MVQSSDYHFFKNMEKEAQSSHSCNSCGGEGCRLCDHGEVIDIEKKLEEEERAAEEKGDSIRNGGEE